LFWGSPGLAITRITGGAPVDEGWGGPCSNTTVPVIVAPGPVTIIIPSMSDAIVRGTLANSPGWPAAGGPFAGRWACCRTVSR
jgi:hypothetical protein